MGQNGGSYAKYDGVGRVPHHEMATISQAGMTAVVLVRCVVESLAKELGRALSSRKSSNLNEKGSWKIVTCSRSRATDARINYIGVP